MSMLQKKKKRKEKSINKYSGCHRKKLGEKWVTFLKGHLDSFKNANLISQAPEYI